MRQVSHALLCVAAPVADTVVLDGVAVLVVGSLGHQAALSILYKLVKLMWGSTLILNVRPKLRVIQC